jgi:Raf kinase inhibitor-like YbhB/YbcL family protein
MRRGVRKSGEPRIAAVLAAALLASPPAALAGHPARNPPAVRLAAASGLALRSPDIPPGGTIALTYAYDQSGCHGGNISPALAWDRPPAGTRSFAITMFDPDAAGGGWWHWAVFDIPAAVGALQAGAGDPAKHLLPAGTTQVRNDFGTLGYGGPCPPPGPPHHYRLILYALRVATLGLDASASPAQVAAKARANALAEAEVVGIYGR